MANLERRTHINNPLRPFEKVQIKDVCPQCESVFVTKRECEACGFQFWVDLVGEPFGPRSFFVLSEDLRLNHPWLTRFSFLPKVQQSQAIQKHKRALLKRFETVVGYLYSSQKMNREEIPGEVLREKKRLFAFEAREVMAEYLNLGGHPSALWVYLEKDEKNPFFTPLTESLYELKGKNSLTPSVKNWLQSHSLGGIINYWFLSKTLIVYGSIILASFFLLKALLKFS